MKKKSICCLLLYLIVLGFIGLTSCSNERQFTESKYNYLRKVPVNRSEQITNNSEHISKNNVQIADNDGCEASDKSELKTDKETVTNDDKATLNISKNKLHRISKLTDRLNGLMFNSPQTQIFSTEKNNSTNNQISEKQQARVAKFMSKLKEIYHHYPPEKIVVMILLIVIAILLLALIGPIAVGFLLFIVLLTVLILLLMHLYW